MKRNYQFIPVVVLWISLFGCNAQINETKENITKPAHVGGAFENNLFAYYGIPKSIMAVDTSPGWNLAGEKLLLTGTVYEPNGTTPASNVLLYYYQTNTEGRYIHRSEEMRSMPPNEKGQTHGYIRGWVKTDSLGRYFIYTVRPGVYPTLDAPAHVHATIKEPGDMNEYYIDDFIFDDDKLLNTAYRMKMENRGGSGVLRLVYIDNIAIGERNIILGLNIPQYPVKYTSPILSGVNVGEDVMSFIPHHAWGPYKGTRTCPVYKYGWYQGILYFVGNNPDWEEIKQWLSFLENESRKREKYLKVYFVYGNEHDYNKNSRQSELEKIGKQLKLEKVALTHVPSFTDSESEIDLIKINQEVDNTFIIFKRCKTMAKFVNLKPSKENFHSISQVLDQSVNEYFKLPKGK